MTLWPSETVERKCVDHFAAPCCETRQCGPQSNRCKVFLEGIGSPESVAMLAGRRSLSPQSPQSPLWIWSHSEFSLQLAVSALLTLRSNYCHQAALDSLRCICRWRSTLAFPPEYCIYTCGWRVNAVNTVKANVGKHQSETWSFIWACNSLKSHVEVSYNLLREESL